MCNLKESVTMPYMEDMKNFVTIAVAAAFMVFTPVPQSFAQEAPSEEGSSLMEKGARLFMRGLMQEMEPALKDLKGLAQEMTPMMRDLQGLIGDMSKYHAPEMLPNGDIIIRRKTPEELAAPEGDEVEL